MNEDVMKTYEALIEDQKRTREDMVNLFFDAVQHADLVVADLWKLTREYSLKDAMIENETDDAYKYALAAFRSLVTAFKSLTGKKIEGWVN